MQQQLRIILVDDSLLDAELAQATLADGGLDCELVRVDFSAPATPFPDPAASQPLPA